MTHLNWVIPLPPPWRYFGKKGDRVLGGWVGPEYLDEVRYDLQDWNLYVHLNPSRGLSPRARAETVTGWRAVLIDLDPAGRDFVSPRVLDGTIAAASELLGCAIVPSVVDTGRGFHLWLHFPEVSPAPEWAPLAVRGFLRDLARKIDTPEVHVDQAVADLSRIARMPGTINLRTGRKATLLAAGQPVDGIPGALGAWKPVRAVVGTLATQAQVPASWGMVLHRVTLSAAVFLTEGAPSGARHDSALKAAYSLADYGVEYAEVVSALRFGNRLCEDPLPDEELDYIAYSAIRRKTRGDQHGSDLQTGGAQTRTPGTYYDLRSAEAWEDPARALDPSEREVG